MLLKVAVCALLAGLLGCSQASMTRNDDIPMGPVADMLDYDKPPTVASPARPEYPDAAREVRAEGRVMVKVLVLEDGRVGAVEILESSHPLLINNAIEAVRRTVFTPATLKGVPVKATVVMPFVFSLDRNVTRTSVEIDPGEPIPSAGSETREPPQQEEPSQRITK
jgi:TonB family protein